MLSEDIGLFTFYRMKICFNGIPFAIDNTDGLLVIQTASSQTHSFQIMNISQTNTQRDLNKAISTHLIND